MTALNRQQRRAQGKDLRRAAKPFTEALTEIPRETWPMPVPELQKLWRSKDWIVEQYAPRLEHSAMVECRLTITPVAQFQRPLAWDEMQAMKAQAGFAALDAVEVFPREQDALAGPWRVLWVLKGLLPFAWRSERALTE